jgi:hypothetical protein
VSKKTENQTKRQIDLGDSALSSAASVTAKKAKRAGQGLMDAFIGRQSKAVQLAGVARYFINTKTHFYLSNCEDP